MSDYHPRQITASLLERLQHFPVVVLAGARQTGKSTLAARVGADRTTLSLDSLAVRDRARHAPEALIQGMDRLTIDEVQRAPDLLLAVKQEVDHDRRPGRFLLTGSANLLLMKSVAESLAGRASYLVLRPMTEREKRRDRESPSWSALLDARSLEEALAVMAGRTQPLDWRQAALLGGFPEPALSADPTFRSLWFQAYADTYIQRDLLDLSQVADLGQFLRFMGLAALRCGGLLNQAELGRDAGVSRATAQRWISLLETSYLTTLLPAFHLSHAKRLIKAPKIYCADTGLGLFLAGIQSKQELERSHLAGVWLENVILNDLLSWSALMPRRPGIFFRRTASGEEVDFIIESSGRLLPMEVKARTTARVRDAQALDAFCAEFPDRSPFGLLLHTGPEAYALTSSTMAVPIAAVL